MNTFLKSILVCNLLLIMVGSQAQPFETFSEGPGEKTIKGHLTRKLLETDTARPDALENIQKQKDSIEIVAFMGTWCEDSHFIIPQLLALLDSAKFPTEKCSLIGVDRNKKTVGRLSEALNVTLVPTIIVFKNGKELGRVVEFGKYGMFDKELAEILR